MDHGVDGGVDRLEFPRSLNKAVKSVKRELWRSIIESYAFVFSMLQ
jgi:hypothetical protein